MTYRDYTEGEDPPRSFIVKDDEMGYIVEARLVDHPAGYWDRIAFLPDGTRHQSTMSDASCLAMLLDALVRGLRVRVQ